MSKGMIRRTLLAMAIAAIGASGTALAQADVSGDFDNPLTLQAGAGGVASVTSSIDNPSIMSPDIDFYGFQGVEGQTVTVDIDAAHSGTGGVDTQIFLFNPAGIMVVAGFDTFPYDAGSTPVPGSTLTRDASLQFNLDSTGLWKIAVVAWPARLTDYGAFDMGMSFAIGNGPYTLIVSGLQAAKQHTDIAIDIKPRDPHNAVTIKEKRGQKIRVALLSDKVFDPFVIDDSSLAFGRTGDEKSLVRCAKHGKDLNGDGKRDRVCRFDVTKTGLDHTDNTGILKVTAGGKPFQGSDSIKVIAKKHDNDRRHDSDRRHDDDDDDDDDD
jgi:hypothetical protein